jgi:hypothetical protein
VMEARAHGRGFEGGGEEILVGLEEISGGKRGRGKKAQ